MSDCPVEDEKLAVIVWAQDSVSQSEKEVLFPVEEIHFVHKIFCNMVVEGGFGWFAEW